MIGVLVVEIVISLVCHHRRFVFFDKSALMLVTIFFVFFVVIDVLEIDTFFSGVLVMIGVLVVEIVMSLVCHHRRFVFFDKSALILVTIFFVFFVVIDVLVIDTFFSGVLVMIRMFVVEIVMSLVCHHRRFVFFDKSALKL